MEQVTDLALLPATCAHWNSGVLVGNCGEIEVIPAARLQKDTRQIVDMETLHDMDNGAGGRVVEARHQSRSDPFSALVARRFGMCILRLQGIVDDDDVAAAASQLTAVASRRATRHSSLSSVGDIGWLEQLCALASS
ncbi:MAG: hypothetical protein E5V94_00515 [Mesorhizobium sp.]|uniref:hypothetical protein n=1 Tax=Mesorhizobium sp. TaxID=1871066 RepID=UPI0011FFB006|nr:hypothetical protein [Mesorhizobium sp.]TIV12465.1 MAG: hypothetical protein E5V94_00515 [Mesorhizobium sp.]